VLKVLFVIPTLAYSGAAKQLVLLAMGLPRSDFETRVCCLGPDGPIARSLREGGIEVASLGWSRRFDLNPFLRLRQLVKSFAPDVIHTWRLPSLRAVCLVGGRRRHLVAGLAGDWPAVDQPWRWLDQKALGRPTTVVAANSDEAESCRRLGLPAERIVTIPPGVASVATTASPPAGPNGPLRWLENARLLVCAGPLEPHKGFKEAIWAYEILRYLFPNLHLVLVGDGPERGRLEQFREATGTAAGVHFVGPVTDLPTWLARAEVVWVPSLKRGGVNVALEGQAAGRPVVASRLPGLAEVVANGETGFLVAAGDKVALAWQTRLLLDDPERGRRMGAAGQERVAQHFAAARLMERFVHLYGSMGQRSMVSR
jgi:glycosyltransferase involved in cell wall biosynthesis